MMAAVAQTINRDGIASGFIGCQLAWSLGCGGRTGAWDGIPEDRLVCKETLDTIRNDIGQLTEGQHLVVIFHDIEEISAQETCSIVGISETNQRVLLHRARARLRQALEDYLQPEH